MERNLESFFENRSWFIESTATLKLRLAAGNQPAISPKVAGLTGQTRVVR
jgi:hypothetical protein